MTLRITVLAAACLMTASCFATGMETPEAEKGKEVVSQCKINLKVSAAHGDIMTIKAVSIMGIRYADNGWIQFDGATENIRFNIYYDPVTNRVICGNENWKRYDYAFNAISMEEYQKTQPILWKAFSKS